MHDIDFVRANFPETLLLARKPVAWGRTSTVLTPENLLAARRMCEAFDEHADLCADEEPALAASPVPGRERVYPSACRPWQGCAPKPVKPISGQPEIAHPGTTRERRRRVDGLRLFIAPFGEFEFMRRALAGTLALALGAGLSACS